jgi:hypothetical protein
MSTLGPFVAAVLRDRTVADLLEENDKLQRQLKQRWAVEITGPEGTPVYAQAQFDQDGAYGGNPRLWRVPFAKNNHRNKDTTTNTNTNTTIIQPCPLSELPNMEVRVGGMCKAKFGNNSDFEGFIDFDHTSSEGYDLNFCFVGGGDLWLDLVIDGWSEEDARAAQAQDIDAEDLLNHLVVTVASTSPTGKVVEFRGVSFFVSSVNGAIQNLSSSPNANEEAREAANRAQREQDPHFYHA